MFDHLLLVYADLDSIQIPRVMDVFCDLHLFEMVTSPGLELTSLLVRGSLRHRSR